MSLRDLFIKIMYEYKDKYLETKKTSDFKDPFRLYISDDIPNVIKSFSFIKENDFKVEGSYGKGRWTAIPWIAVFNKKITTSARKGVYIVYLLNIEKKELYLTLNQAATEIKNSNNMNDSSFISVANNASKEVLDNLKNNAELIRTKLNVESFLFSAAIDTGSKSYDAGCIYYKKYTLSNIPSDEKLKEDLKLFVDIYNLYYENIYLGLNTSIKIGLNDNKTEESNLKKGAYNKIFYGIPGCGKSHHIEHTVLKNADKENNVFRTTFYLDYSYNDFIGQLMPDIDDEGKPSYQRIPGPFTEALKRSYELLKDYEYDDESKKVYLVIEEINRGNAAAIFGDTFQLLDRLKVDCDGRYVGDSEYPISNIFIKKYLEKEKVHYIPDKIYIPRNMIILATMNTSDQNVFPLDTAFKRRWDRERVTADWSKCTFKDDYIPFTDYTWYDFVNLVNDKMIKSSEDGMILEDKQIGAFFINKDILASKDDKDIVNEENKTKLRKFVNNVIDYIYTDVSKFDRKNWFKEQISFDDIYDAICKYEYKKDENDQVILDTNNKPIEEYHGDKELYLLLDTIKNKVADLYG